MKRLFLLLALSPVWIFASVYVLPIAAKADGADRCFFDMGKIPDKIIQGEPIITKTPHNAYFFFGEFGLTLQFPSCVLAGKSSGSAVFPQPFSKTGIAKATLAGGISNIVLLGASEQMVWIKAGGIVSVRAIVANKKTIRNRPFENRERYSMREIHGGSALSKESTVAVLRHFGLRPNPAFAIVSIWRNETEETLYV